MARARAQLGISKPLFDLLDGQDEVTRAVFAAAAADAADHWHKRILERHFQAGAPGRYPGAYVLNTKAYQIRKARKFHHQRPMVWSGSLLRTMKSGYSLASSVTRRLVRQTIRLPQARVLNIWNRNSRHDFAAAIQAVNAQDFDELRGVMERSVTQHLAAKMNEGGEVVSTHTV